MTPLQWIALVAGIAFVGGLLLSAVMLAAHDFLFAIQQMRQGWAPAPS